jgi:diacylglycerol O-acyltransferase / wax synthase
MHREAASGSRLTPMESLMWRLECDRALSATFGSITFLDREPDRGRFSTRMEHAVRAVPRFRQRIDTGGPPTAAATWVDHADFDLDRHLEWQTCPGEGTERDVLDLATRLVATPFDPDAPPWNFIVVTGLLDGRAALVQRMHHAITDGKGGIRISEQFIDLERDPPSPTRPPDEPELGPDASGPATWVERAVHHTSDRAADLVRTATDAVRWTAGGFTDPARFAQLGADVVETTQSLRRQLVVVERARSPLWATRSTSRRMVVGSVPFDLARAAATDAGVSINDVFVTATLRGVAAYHRILGAPVDDLRVAVPVSTRSGRDAGGNAFSPTRVLLPSGEVHTAAAHLRVVSDHMSQTKAERATGLIEPLAAASELIPTPALRAVVTRQAATIDYTASNLRAAPFPLYIAGALIEATYAVGPLAATAANITMMSYNGRIDLGIHVDAEAVTDPDLLRDTVVAAFHEVCEAARTLA